MGSDSPQGGERPGFGKNSHLSRKNPDPAGFLIGTGIIWIPTAAWLAHIDESGWAVFTVVWGITINVMDNFIKPYFIGLSSPLPFLLIMVGVVGGLLAWGFVGIFLGTTLLAVAYTTFFAWLERPEVDKNGLIE